MSRTVNSITAWHFRTLPKDIGVALVVLVALLLGLLLRWWITGDSRSYQSSDNSFRMSYPATWRTNTVTDTVVLRVENPQTGSAYKTNVTVESRDLDPAGPPTLQDLIDRRVVQHGTLVGYHFLSSEERTIAGSRAAEVDYAYVDQPIDQPRRASLPVVVRNRECIVLTKNRAYFITLAAPESDYSDATSQFDNMLQTVNLQ